MLSLAPPNTINAHAQFRNVYSRPEECEIDRVNSNNVQFLGVYQRLQPPSSGKWSASPAMTLAQQCLASVVHPYYIPSLIHHVSQPELPLSL